MAWKKYIKRQGRRFGRFLKKRYISKGGLGRAIKDVAYLKSIVNVERKFVDASVLYSDGAVELDWNGVIYDCTAVAQGATDSTRNGNSIKSSGLDTLITMVGNTGASTGVTRIRCLLCIDKFNQDTDPVVTDILESALIGTSTSIVALKNDLTRQRFKILYDRVHTVDLDNNQSKTFRVYRKLWHHIKYSGANATDQLQGQVFWLFISDQDPAVANSTPTMRVVTRYRYIDN